MSKAYQSTFTGETNTPYSKQFVHSKSSQYRRLKTEWKNNVYLARSRIQGLGLYAAKDIEKHTMVIEYIGTIIRNEVANRREKIYEEQVGLWWDAGGCVGTWARCGGTWVACWRFWWNMEGLEQDMGEADGMLGTRVGCWWTWVGCWRLWQDMGGLRSDVEGLGRGIKGSGGTWRDSYGI